MRKLSVAAALLLSVVMLSAQSQKHPAAGHSPAKTAVELPTAAEVDQALQRNFGYDPAITWKVLHIAPSDAPGIADVVVLLNNKDYVNFYVLPSGQKAIRGEMVPFGPNPFAENRSKLRPADGPLRGPENAVISIVEFSDLECPYCKAAQPNVDKLASDFPRVRFIFQQFPLPMHPWAMKAALYADCAGQQNQAAFWKFIDSVFENQGSIALATVDDKLKEFATAAGFDAQKLSACAALPATEARVKKSIALGQSVGVQGTPTVFINGRSLPGLGGLDYDHLKELVEFESQHAGK
jgi:protein-disulfide isomerase